MTVFSLTIQPNNMKFLKWTLVLSVLLGVLAIAISVAKQTKSTNGRPKAIGRYIIGNQFGLRGLDWNTEGLMAQTVPIEPDKIYRLPKRVYWADAVNGDTLASWRCLKIWWDLSDPSQPERLSKPLSANLATVKDMLMNFDTLVKYGELGVSVPQRQSDLIDGDSVINRATLFVVTQSNN